MKENDNKTHTHDYKNTLCLPKTSFPMKANLIQKEPEILRFWEENTIYKKMLHNASASPKYILHDGPPYANGHIHLGTALNKILKDIIIKSKFMKGFCAPYVPGWDCHGLPIELQVEQSLKEKNKTDISKTVLRKICREHATKFIGIQKKEFARLGVFADWTTVYTTMSPHYEGSIIELTARLVERGNIMQSKKPIYWCCSCKTALAEAEVEYHNHKSHSIYVAFPIVQCSKEIALPLYAVIWTTTPWTIPSNQAIALHPEYEYSIVEAQGNAYIIATDLLEKTLPLFGLENYSILLQCKGIELDGTIAKHPLYERNSPFVFAKYVTLESGTGLVHTAPGHGREDYETGLKYTLPIYSPIDDEGVYTNDVQLFAGRSIFEGNLLVVDALRKHALLLHDAKMDHSYPHCWRCRKPVIFRATKQWFISLEENDLRKKALSDIKNTVNWIPSWGENRIYAMVEARPDWCISRQRTWGVPIVALHCSNCGKTYNEASFIYKVAEYAKKHLTGSDIWYELSTEDIIEQFAPNLSCSCGSKSFTKEMDILDVWFDSASSCYAVLQNKGYALAYPADLYLEGSDQHRGWFHSSLLLSEGAFDSPPYKNVVTHGYVVDGKGYKMSKSIGNVIAPEEIISKYGAEIVRLWVSSVEYKEDIRISEEILARLLEAYRRIRNTCRYMLGNLHGFTAHNCIPFEEMDALDRYALANMYAHHNKIQEAFEAFEFHKCYQTLYSACITDLSAIYFDIIKERLYLSAEHGKDRRSALTAVYYILQMILIDVAPILSFTAEEAWQHIADFTNSENKESIFLQKAEDIPPFILSKKEEVAWEALLSIRSLLTKALEPMRAGGTIGHSFDVDVAIYLDEKLPNILLSLPTDLRVFFIVSSVTFHSLNNAPTDALKTEGIEIDIDSSGITTFPIFFNITPAQGEKCERCWVYSTECGSNAHHPALCPRCTQVVTSL